MVKNIDKKDVLDTLPWLSIESVGKSASMAIVFQKNNRLQIVTEQVESREGVKDSLLPLIEKNAESRERSKCKHAPNISDVTNAPCVCACCGRLERCVVLATHLLPSQRVSLLAGRLTRLSGPPLVGSDQIFSLSDTSDAKRQTVLIGTRTHTPPDSAYRRVSSHGALRTNGAGHNNES